MMIRRVLAFLVLMSLPCAAYATPLEDVIKPEGGSAACFTRVYDTAHLKAHPTQRITAISVWLRYDGPPGAPANANRVLSDSISLTRRGDPAALFSDGGCTFDANRDTSDRRLIKAYPRESGFVCMQSAQPDVFEATSAEEGGNLILDRGKDRDTLMVYLDQSLTMVKRTERRKHQFIEFGPDDRVFMLRRANIKECSAIVEAVTAPEPAATSPSRGNVDRE